MRYKLLVWDFDGTLADSLPISLEIFNRMAGEHGFKPILDPQIVRTMTILRFIRAHRIPLIQVPRLIRKFLVSQSQMMPTTPLYPELATMLLSLTDQGARLGIVSFNKELNIRTCLKASQVEQHFEFVIGCGGLFGKRRALRKVVKSHGFKRHEVLYIGDEVRDVVAARKAGVDMAAVTWGFNSSEVLAKHNPTYLVGCPEELLETILRPRPAVLA